MANELLLAVDPGAGGAFAWITGEGFLIAVEDMPVIELIVNGHKRRRINAPGIASLMLMRPITRVVVEKVVNMPRRDASGNMIAAGSTSASAAARGAGLIEGAAAILGLPYEELMPHVWKRKSGVPKDKGGARQMAQRMWPGLAGRFSRVRDDGRAEAALLAHWAVTR